MSTVADYVGRTSDVLAFIGARPAGEVLLQQFLAAAGNSGEICTGVQKLVQRWLLEFLTETGTMPWLPVRGCDFTGQAARGELRTTLDAEQAFYLAADTVRSNLIAEETTDMPDDERYGSATLLSVVVQGDLLTLRISLQSLAGTARPIILPIGVRAA